MKHVFLLLIFFTTFSYGACSQTYTIYINEILASNKYDIQDDFFQNNDWFELYFPAGQGVSVLNLAGYYLSDNPNNLIKYQIPDNNIWILADGFKLFWADNDILQGSNHVNFKFSLDGESLYLTEPDGLTVVDSVDFPTQATDISYGRSCDACADWVFFNNTTPEASNMELTLPSEILFINEVQALNNSTTHDALGGYDAWIEIYNPNTYQVNLAGYSFSNNSGDYYQLPFNDPVKTVVGANSWRLIWCDGQENEGSNHVDWVLSPEGGIVTMVGTDGVTVVDVYDYLVGAVDESWGRQSDGSPSSVSFVTPTPRVTNQLVIVWPEELYINEIMAANITDTVDTALEYEDWFEVYNPNNYAVDLMGYYFSDNPEVPMKWQVPFNHPDSSLVSAHGWLLFWCDEDGGAVGSQGWNHVSFKLANFGEQLTMRSPDGFTIADHVVWGVQTDDISLGRQQDGASQWVFFSETTPEHSNNGAVVNVQESSVNLKKLMAYPNPIAQNHLRFSEKVSGQLFDARGRWVMEIRDCDYLLWDSSLHGMFVFKSRDERIVRILAP